MATEPGNKDGGKPSGDNKSTGDPTPASASRAAAPGSTSAPTPGPGREPVSLASPLAADPRPPGKPTKRPASAQPQKLVETPSETPAERQAAIRSGTPSLSARSADRLAAMAPPPKPQRGGGLTFLLVIAIIAGGGYLLWRDGRLDPLIAWAQPYSDKIRPFIAEIRALIPGHQTPAPPSDDAMIQETKQLLLKLDFQPGPINGTLDPATIAAIESYQETAGLPIDGQPSPALLDELRAVTSPSSN